MYQAMIHKENGLYRPMILNPTLAACLTAKWVNLNLNLYRKWRHFIDEND